MSKEKEILLELQALMDAGNLVRFSRLYDCTPDLARYHFLTGPSAKQLLLDALDDNKPEFVAFLVDRLGMDTLTDARIVRPHPCNDSLWVLSPLYLAITNGMEDLALRLIRHPKTDLEYGRRREFSGLDPMAGIAYPFTLPDETLFDAAARAGNVKIIEALYDETIRRLESKVQDVQQNSLIFTKRRTKELRTKIAAFEQARDEMLNTQKRTAPRKRPQP